MNTKPTDWTKPVLDLEVTSIVAGVDENGDHYFDFTICGSRPDGVSREQVETAIKNAWSVTG